MPPPTRPSAGRPKWPKISDQLSSALSAIPRDAQPQNDARALERGDEVAKQLEQEPGRGAPHVGAKERLPLARKLLRIARTRASGRRRATAAANKAASTCASSHRPARKVRRTSRTALDRWPSAVAIIGDEAMNKPSSKRLKVKVRLSAKRRCCELGRAEAAHQQDVGRLDRLLRQVGENQRPGEREHRAELLASTRHLPLACRNLSRSIAWPLRGA